MMEMHRPPRTFARASEITVTTIAGEILVLEAPGFFAEIKMHWSGIRLLLTTEQAPEQPGSDPLYCVKIGNDSIVLLPSEEQANALVDSISKVLLASNVKSRKPDINPDSLSYKLGSFVETCGTAVVVAFLAAGMAHIGWLAFAPAAESVAALLYAPKSVSVTSRIGTSYVRDLDSGVNLRDLDKGPVSLEEVIQARSMADDLAAQELYAASQKEDVSAGSEWQSVAQKHFQAQELIYELDRAQYTLSKKAEYEGFIREIAALQRAADELNEQKK